MGKGFALLALLAVSGSVPLQAEEAPWCVQVDVFTKNCGFTNYNECVKVAQDAVGPATGASRCIRNPNYQPPVTPVRGKPAPGKQAAPPH